MKILIRATLALLLLTSAAQAQNADTVKSHRRQRAESLNLTAAQQTELKAIRENHQKERQALEAQDNITVKEWKARRKELQQKHRAQLKAVLTPEQQQQQKRLATMHHRHGKGMKAHRGQQARKVAAQLNLTDAQKAEMKSLHQNFRTKRAALRSNTELAEAPKKEQLRELAQQHRQQANAVLTPEQQQKLEALRREHRSKTGK